MNNIFQALGLVTLSAGVAAYPIHGSSGVVVIGEADAALYQRPSRRGGIRWNALAKWLLPPCARLLADQSDTSVIFIGRLR